MMRRTLLSTVLAALTLILPCSALAASGGIELQGIVKNHAMGDTIEVVAGGKSWLVRLYGAAAPRLDQPWGKESYEALKEAIPIGTTVKLRIVGNQTNERILAEVYRKTLYVNGYMVQTGNAWAADPDLPSYSNFHELEMRARRDKKGLWTLDEAVNVPPWQWDPLW